jgi:hypothetical protein
LNEKEPFANKRIWTLILIMLVLLILGPFLIEIRVSTYFYPVVSLSDFTIYAWTWIYRIAGYGTIGFSAYPSSLPFQQATVYTFIQLAFLGTIAGYQLGLSSLKTARQIGYISLFPGLLILGVNLLGILVPGATEIIVPIPVPLASIIGFLMLKLKSSEQEPDEWLSEEQN